MLEIRLIPMSSLSTDDETSNRSVPYWKLFDGYMYIVINKDPPWGFIPQDPFHTLTVMTAIDSSAPPLVLTSLWNSTLTIIARGWKVSLEYRYTWSFNRRYSATIDLSWGLYHQFISDGWNLYGSAGRPLKL